MAEAEAEFDLEALAAYLRAQRPGLDGPLRLQRFAGGQSNPTYALDVGEQQWVLRSKPGPKAKLLPSAHAIEREFRLLQALHGSPVPVPAPYLLCEDESVIGRAFYLMQRMQGRIFWDPTLAELPREQRGAYYEAMNDTLAALHQLDPATLGLADFAASGNYFERQISRWTRQYRASETQPIAAMEALIEWLPGQIPAEGPARIVHGDFRIDNLVFHPEQPRVIAVLDWELSTLGPALADFAYHCLAWFTPPGPLRGLAGLDLPALGLPSLDDYVQRYAQSSGQPIALADLPFYLAYNLFRLAGIAQGIAKRAQQGTASSAQAVQTGALAIPIAELGWKIAQG